MATNKNPIFADPFTPGLLSVALKRHIDSGVITTRFLAEMGDTKIEFEVRLVSVNNKKIRAIPATLLGKI